MRADEIDEIGDADSQTTARAGQCITCQCVVGIHRSDDRIEGQWISTAQTGSCPTTIVQNEAKQSLPSSPKMASNVAL